ncbi:MAG: tetratricopeptide repeat protein [Spirochaetaceae bacterium]|jgi:outer membrane protein assembly factor BamD (BamD/ComL family)|nr:tetratricopeptide repeat protein [Spirochaetaceae bacterium]
MKKILLIACLAVCGCNSTPNVSQTASVMEIIQKAQEATDRDRYGLAIHYYSLLLDRFPYDRNAVCTAQYEIAFIHYKQKKYAVSKAEFEELLRRYNERDSELLPPEYKILSEKGLKKINAKFKEAT